MAYVYKNVPTEEKMNMPAISKIQVEVIRVLKQSTPMLSLVLCDSFGGLWLSEWHGQINFF